MDHYFTNNQKLKSNINMLNKNIRGKEYLFYTDNGVFSKSALDFGTKLLIEALPFEKMQGTVLDMGCGYGPIGLSIKNETTCEVDMVDINLRALHLAKMNAKKNKLDVNIFESDAYTNIRHKYNYIITNPPIRAGKKKVYEILRGANNYLNENGELWFVLRKDQGAKTTVRDIGDIYTVKTIVKDKGYFVFCATKRGKSVDIA